MTVDDENAVYVGGLPYECTESQLRRAFELYGSILAVKIINDRGIGGKCYCFVTYTNPRSAAEAIDEMDGRTIGGRVVRVNEVKTRGASGRSNYGRENFRRNERDMDLDKRRTSRRENDYDRDKHRDHSRDHDGKSRKGKEAMITLMIVIQPIHSIVEIVVKIGTWRDGTMGLAGIVIRNGREMTILLPLEIGSLMESMIMIEGVTGTKIDTQRKHSSSSYDQQSRERSSESIDYHHQVEEQLHLLNRRQEELQEEKSDMERRLEEKKEVIANLQKKSLKLEDGLTSAKKLSSMRQMQLTKLYQSYRQVKEFGERLKNSEQELQDLVYSVSNDIDTDGDLGAKDVYFVNG